MEEVLQPDLCVIGAGSGGLSVAAAAAQFGVPVVLIEKGRMGGDCLNYGCVPSKALIRSAKFLSHVKRCREFGVASASAQFDFAEVMERVQRVIREPAGAGLDIPGDCERGEHDAQVGIDGFAFVVVDGPGLQVASGHPEGFSIRRNWW